jgi:hypothetical protein
LREGVRGDGVGEADGAQALVRRDPPGDPGGQLPGVGGGARPWHHHRDRHLAVVRVGAAEDGGVGDRRVAGEQRLQLGRGDLVPADLDELLEPVDDDHVAVAVDQAQVAGGQPAVGVDRHGRLAQGWTAPAATDWVWARAQPSAFAHLVVDRGWPAGDYTDRVVGSNLSELAGPPA